MPGATGPPPAADPGAMSPPRDSGDHCIVGGPFVATRELFLRCLSCCYFVAFASFLVQVPGLYSVAGLVPTSKASAMERECMWGLLLSALGMVGCANVPVMWGVLGLYGHLVGTAPAPFYNFQWDILLLEAGFVAILLAPLLHASLEPRPSRAVLWIVRVVLFKLMLMSGVVKLTEGDESWRNLTAVWYHFATQCIPTPAAWYFHHLPIYLNRLFCAIMFLIEIPAAFLILVPVRPVRLFAAFLQIALQLVIILTGNFTFFNYLTIFLACSLVDGDVLPAWVRPAEPLLLPGTRLRALLRSAQGKASVPAPGASTPPAAAEEGSAGAAAGSEPGTAPAPGPRGATDATPLLAEQQVGAGAPAPTTTAARPDTGEILVNAMLDAAGVPEGAPRKRAERLGAWICLAVCLLGVLARSWALGLNPSLHVTISNRDLLDWCSTWVPLALIWVSVVLPVVTALDIADALRLDSGGSSSGATGGATSPRIPWSGALQPRMVLPRVLVVVLMVLRLLGCARLLTSTPPVMGEIAPSLLEPRTIVTWWGSHGGGGGDMQVPIPGGLPSYGPYGYGLFRVMTGIGPDGRVARPEVVLEVKEATSGKWLELQFPYKPGAVQRRPPVVAPYQPRLDWQMWFQALTPDPDNWFENLVRRVTEGSPVVLGLLDTGSLPSVDVAAIRAVKYTYNFTRYGEAGWWQRTRQDKDDAPGGGAEVPFPAPLNLAHRAAERPWDWRPMFVVVTLFVAVLVAACPRLVLLLGPRWLRVEVCGDRKDA